MEVYFYFQAVAAAPGYWFVKTWENMLEIDVMLLIASHLQLFQHNLDISSHFLLFFSRFLLCKNSFISGDVQR